MNHTEWQRFQQRWISAVYADRDLSHAERLTLTCFGRYTLRPGYVACKQVKLAQLVGAYTKQGERLVTGDDPAMNDDTWRVVDWRTNEVIAEGDDGEAGYNAAFERLDPGKTWHHIDRATTAHGDVDPLPNTVMPGLPSSLCEVLVEWVEDQRATDEELAEFIGWPVEQVRGCRDQT